MRRLPPWRPTSWSSRLGRQLEGPGRQTRRPRSSPPTPASQVEFITGGTIDRLNKAKLAKGNPESDITFTTSHVGWLYATDGLYRDARSGEGRRTPRTSSQQAKISPYHIGTWAYVYTIGYRPDLVPAGIKFDSWADLWKPELKGKLSAPDFDPSHLVVVAAMLVGRRRGHLGEGPGDKLKALKPNFKAFYANDAGLQQLMQNGEAPVQVMLSMNAYYMPEPGRAVKLAIPKEGAVLGIDTIGIMKGTKKADLAYKFINTMLDPAVQAEIARPEEGQPGGDQRQARSRRSPSCPACSPRPISGTRKPSSSTTSCAPRRPANGASGSPRT